MRKFISMLSATAIAVIVFSSIIAYNNDHQGLTLPEVREASVSVGGFCSGTVIHDPIIEDGKQITIITANHCTDAVGQIIPILGEDGQTYKFMVVRESPTSDISLLQALKADIPIEAFPVEATLLPSEPIQGAEACTTGFPYLQDIVPMGELTTCGYLSGFLKADFFKDIVKSELLQIVTLFVNPGSSGGGLFVNVDGKYYLSGVLTGKFTRSNEVGWFSTYSDFNKFMTQEIYE